MEIKTEVCSQSFFVPSGARQNRQVQFRIPTWRQSLGMLALTAGTVWTPSAWAQASPLTAVNAPSATLSHAGDTPIVRAADGLAVTRNDVLADAQRMPEASRQVLLARPQTVQNTAEALLLRRVIANLAKAKPLAQDPLLQASVQQAQDKVLSDAYLRHLRTQYSPSNEALERYARTRFQAEPARYAQPAQTRARHILLSKNGGDARTKAEAVLKALREGASFEETAKRESLDAASAARGGDLGLFGPGRMVKPFEEAVDALRNPGELSDLVETQFGFHIIRLEERKPARTPEFEELRQTLMEEARVTLENEKIQEFMKELRAGLRVDDAALSALTQDFAQQLGLKRP